MPDTLNTFKLRTPMPTEIDAAVKEAVITQSITSAHQEAALNACRVVNVTMETETETYSFPLVNDDDKVQVNEREILVFTVDCEPVTTVGVLADSVQDGLAYASKRWDNNTYPDLRVIVVADRVAFAKLYGYRDMPFVVDPNIKTLLWHRDIQQHIRAGRIMVVPSTPDAVGL